MTEQAHAPAGLGSTKLVSPKTVEEACLLLRSAKDANQSAVMLAGGTDWIVDRHLSPIGKAHGVDLVVDLTAIENLTHISEKTEGNERFLILGGGVTYWQLREDARVAALVPMLGVMAKDVGAVQIQTRGTLAGNIASASPAADGVPALMALDGEVTLAKAGSTRTVALEKFFTAYRKTVIETDELIVAIRLRVPPPGASVVWRKVGTRLAQAISKVALASVIETLPDAATIRRARFGMASVAAVTHPLPRVRAYLEGRKLADVARGELDAVIEQEIKPIDDVRSTGEYRLHVAKALVWRAIHTEAREAATA